MGVERVDYSSDQEYLQAVQQEIDEGNQPHNYEPNLVPCILCGRQMYEKSSIPKENFCEKCEEQATEKAIMDEWEETEELWEKDNVFQGESIAERKFRYIKKRGIELFNKQIQKELKLSFSGPEEKLVLGRGNTSATFMFIGEVPSKEDAEESKALVGKSGVILDMLLENGGIKTSMPEEYDDYYITNLIKEKPNKITQLKPVDAERCFLYLKDEINLVKPEYIICLGEYVIKTLFKYYKIEDSIKPINEIHGQLFEGTCPKINKKGEYDKVKLVAMYSPHRSLYHKKERKIMLDDMNILSGDYLLNSSNNYFDTNMPF